MKIAAYLGSFNPYHLDHSKVVHTAIDDFKMDKVIIVPTMQNPWKSEKVLDINKRVKIIQSVEQPVNYFGDCYGDPRIEISLLEQSLTPPYYSYATLHALKNQYCNDKLFILCGEDTISDIPNWMNGEQIMKDYDFLVVDRPKYAISSSSIRELLRTRYKMDSHYSDSILEKYVHKNSINLIKNYY